MSAPALSAPPRALEELVAGPLERLADRHGFTEGPLWSDAEGGLLFSDTAADTVFLWRDGQMRPFQRPAGQPNGLAFDPGGRLLICQHGARRIARVDGEALTTVVDRYEGKRLNSPNDLVVRPDGAIFFTDPPYGVPETQRELDFQGVFRRDAGGALHLVADDFVRPNGVALAPDGARLYVSDTAEEHVRVFTVDPDGRTRGGKRFVDLQSDRPGDPDGLAVDEFGDLYVTGGGGVRVVTPDGALLGTIPVPEPTTNCCFGEPDRRTLYITARPRVYRIRLAVRGA